MEFMLECSLEPQVPLCWPMCDASVQELKEHFFLKNTRVSILCYVTPYGKLVYSNCAIPLLSSIKINSSYSAVLSYS